MTPTPMAKVMGRLTPSAWLEAVLGAILIYMVVLGGTSAGDIDPSLRILNALLAAALVVAYVARLPGRFDSLDVAVLVALVLFSVAGAFSLFRRQSFDAVLAALAFAATVHLVRDLLSKPAARRLFLISLVGLSASFTLLLTGKWIMPVLEWWSRTDWSVIPPLNFELGASPWGHRHDLALLVVMLYPAWWLGRPGIVRRALALAVLFLDVGIVLVDGSRAVWLGVAVASAALVLPRAQRWARNRRISRSTIAIGVGGAGLIIFAALATGIGGSLVQRVGNLATLDYRTAMWGAILGDWGNHPLTGAGPGSFPWLLQLTPYFDTNSWAPRHPDSSVMQAIAEGGLLGLSAISVLVVVVGSHLRWSSSSAATWCLIVFATTALLASPTDFAFLIVVALGWLAYALPRQALAGAAERRVRFRPVTMASLACVGIIGVAFGMSSVAVIAYERARVALVADHQADVHAQLDLAVALDPGMALYRRERGVLRLERGLPGAVGDLQSAVQLNPADDLAWRSLAIARLVEGDIAGAEGALATALDRQQSDATNLMLQARFETLHGRPDVADMLVARIVQAWPTTVFAPGWKAAELGNLSTPDAVDQALRRWTNGMTSPEPLADQEIWLAVMDGQNSDRVTAAVDRSGLGAVLGGALARAIACEPPEVPFDEMGNTERRTYLYWWLRARSDHTSATRDQEASRMATLMGHPLPTEVDSTGLNPLNENDAFSADRWGYRRTPIEWRDAPMGLALPSPSAGLTQWLLDVRTAVSEAGVDAALPKCLDVTG